MLTAEPKEEKVYKKEAFTFNAEPKMFALVVGGQVIILAGIYFYKTNTNSSQPHQYDA